MNYNKIANFRCFNGYQKVLQHFSSVLNCKMNFGIYLPDNDTNEKLPVLFYLSGLTCNENNFIEKSGHQRFASFYRVIVVNCDTSPRGVHISGDDQGFVGLGAGFYLDAVQPKWSKHYKMYSYFVEEFVPFIFNHFPINNLHCGIIGHSMGGHGALTIGLRNPSVFKSISAFAPVCSALSSPLCKLAYSEYLGNSPFSFPQYDAVEVAKAYTGPKRLILVDQGSNDSYLYSNDLLPDKLINVKNTNIEWKYNLHKNYEHGYYFISTFIESHFKFHLESWN